MNHQERKWYKKRSRGPVFGKSSKTLKVSLVEHLFPGLVWRRSPRLWWGLLHRTKRMVRGCLIKSTSTGSGWSIIYRLFPKLWRGRPGFRTRETLNLWRQEWVGVLTVFLLLRHGGLQRGWVVRNTGRDSFENPDISSSLKWLEESRPWSYSVLSDWDVYILGLLLAEEFKTRYVQS